MSTTQLLPSRTMVAFAVAVALLAVGTSLYKPTAQTSVAALSKSFVATIESSYPSRSGSYPYNVVISSSPGDEVNEIGQRKVNNSVPNVSFLLAENGVGNTTGLRLDSQDFKDVDHVIYQHCCTTIAPQIDPLRCAPNSGARLISDTGVRLLSFNDLENGQRVYCVPQGTHFVWPLHEVGKEFYPKNVLGPIPGQPIKLKQLSMQPRVFSVSNFVSPEEIEELMRTNLNRLTPSEVGFGGWQDETRTSSTSWDERSKASQLIQKRTFEILGMDYNPQLADTLQVLRYTSEGSNGTGQWYKPHTDWFDESSYDGHNPQVNNGSNRFATMFLYLSDVQEGGATVFPHSTTHEGYNGEQIVHDGTIDTPSYINTGEARRACMKNSTALKMYPIQGHAVLFYSQGPYGELDAYSLHGGCPPLQGTKMSANVWVWNRKSPPKSSAKDKDPNRGGSKVEGQLRIEFINTSKQELQVFWDGNTPQTGLDDLEQFTKQYSVNPDRFHLQGSLKPGRRVELTSYNGHVFVTVDVTTKQVVHVAVASESNTEFKL
ncbi:hypothetical protein BASA81_011086 [Batrachochytrium salamandrivorans]|nr:hypothetical protein BASA81_011086 [Batrachochytrium salamandrivorans]